MQTTTDTQPQTATAAHSAPTAFNLTERAVSQLKSVIQENGFEGYFLTIRVVPAGCSGLGYDLNLVKESKADDTLWEQNGIHMATDKMSASYLDGTTVDYESSIQGAGFKFSNPNAKSSCGCGTSFTT